MPSAILPEASLPIFDFSKFLNGESSERKKAANQIVDAFKTFGFVYLMDHGISQVEIETLFNWVCTSALYSCWRSVCSPCRHILI